MNSAKLSSKFQLAIPKDIREQMNLKVEVALVLDREEVNAKPCKQISAP